MLAAGGFVSVAVIVVLTLAAFRRNRAVPVSLRTAIRIGFVALVGSVVVGALHDRQGHDAGIRWQSAGRGSATGGALKPTHAVMMHAILVLPALAWLLSFVNWTEQRRLGVVLLAATGFVVVVGVVTVGNLVGLELHQMPSAANGLLAAGALLLLSVWLMTIKAVAAHTANGIPRSG